MSRKRKHRSAVCDFVNASDEGAGLSVLSANELITDYSNMRSPLKKHRVNERPRLHQSIDENPHRTCSDEVQVLGSHISSIYHTDPAEETYFSGQQQVTSTADKQQLSNFEELLFDLISENDCSQLYSQNSGTAGVTECAGEQLHSDICHSLNDSGSDSSHAYNSNISTEIDTYGHYSVKRNNAHPSSTNGSLSNSCNPNAANSEFHTGSANIRSVNIKTVLSQSAEKQNKNTKPQKWPTDYAKLWNKSECYKKKPEQKRCSTVGSLTQTEAFSFNSDHCGLLRTVNRRGAVCRKISTHISTQTTEEANSIGVLQLSNKHGLLRRRSKKVTEDWTVIGSSHSVPDGKNRHRVRASSTLVNDICSNSNSNSESLFSLNEGNCERVVDNYSIETAAAIDHADSSFQNTEVEQDIEDYSSALSAFCSKENELEKQATFTEDVTQSKHFLTLSHKKKKKSRHRERDGMPSYTAESQRMGVDNSSATCAAGVSLPVSSSCLEQNVSHTDGEGSVQDGYIDILESGMQQKQEKIAAAENQCTVENEVCRKSCNSGMSPCKNKSYKKTTSEFTSPSVCSDSKNWTLHSPVVKSIVNIQKTDYRNDSSQTAGILFRDSLACSVEDTDGLLLQENLPKEQSTDMCENIQEDQFEQLLLNSLVGEKSPVESRSDYDKSCHGDFAVNTDTKEPESELSDSTSDDDFDDMSMGKQSMSVSLLKENLTDELTGKHKQQVRSKKVTKDWTDFEGSHSTPVRSKRRHEHVSSALVNDVCSNSNNQSLFSHNESHCVDSGRRVTDSYSIETAAAIDRTDSSSKNIEVEPDIDDYSTALPASCGTENELNMQAMLTEDCTESKHFLMLSHKKKKGGHHECDRMSLYTTESQRMGVENSSAACETGVSLPVSSSFLQQNFSHSDEDTGGLLLEQNLPNEQYTDLCENTQEDWFEQLLLNSLVGEKSPVESRSDHDKSCREDLDVNTDTKEPESELSDSTSDEDFDDMAMGKQRISVNSLPISPQTGSARYKAGLWTDVSKNRQAKPVNCVSDVKKSQHGDTCSSDRSPSLFDSTSLHRFSSGVRSPVDLEKVSDIDRSALRMTDVDVTPDKSV